MGWVNKRRDLGSLIFVDLRDRTGVTQVVINAERDTAVHKKAEALRNEYVIAVTGTVKLRDSSTVNKNIATGEVELVAEELRILNESKLPPFLPSDTALTNEETRLKYRYIDLRRDVMQFNIELRHKVAKAIRDYLSGLGFFEIETPFMTRSTREGARDYLVPSRVQPGTFYALPQSPQMFKQILMISGFDKYFQIVRCFRDEDLRADRQPEFTQIDLEMAYPQPERVWAVVEGFLTAAFRAAGFEIKAPFPRMDYDDAIRLYGVDKPDLRLPAFTDVRDCFTAENLQELAINANLPVVAVRTPNVGELSRKERDDIKPMFHSKGRAKIFEDFKRIANKFPEAAVAIAKKTGMEASDLIVLVAGSVQAETQAVVSEHRKVTPQELAIYASAGLLRLALAQKYAERHGIFKKTGDAAKDFRFLWVTNFPMFEWDEGEKTWNAAHHPFTSPHEQDMKLLEEGVEALHDPLSPLSAVRALAYDVVLNGTELGSGSIRIHRQDVQSRIFRALGLTEEEARARFGFFLEALEYGTPPHGGIALGLDRIVMILAGAESLREVIPFPKTADAVDLMAGAPASVDDMQLREVSIQTRGQSYENPHRQAWFRKVSGLVQFEPAPDAFTKRRYRSKGGEFVIVPFCSERPSGIWSLKIPNEPGYSSIVLLCLASTGELLDFVIPKYLVERIREMNKEGEWKRWIPVTVTKEGGNFLMKVGLSPKYRIDVFRSNRAYLKSLDSRPWDLSLLFGKETSRVAVPLIYFDTQIVSAVAKGDIRPADWQRVIAYVRKHAHHALSLNTIYELLAAMAFGKPEHFRKYRKRFEMLEITGNETVLPLAGDFVRNRVFGYPLSRPD